MSKTKKLPDKLSELIRVAVADAKKVQKDKRYRFNMGSWHVPASVTSTNKCEVCLAGAVIAKTFECSPDEYKSPGYYSQDTAEKLSNIDNIRTGYIPYLGDDSEKRVAVRKASEIIQKEYNLFRSDKERLHYPVSSRARWSTYLRAADILEKAGL